jgi:hypothetical protein
MTCGYGAEIYDRGSQHDAAGGHTNTGDQAHHPCDEGTINVTLRCGARFSSYAGAWDQVEP